MNKHALKLWKVNLIIGSDKKMGNLSRIAILIITLYCCARYMLRATCIAHLLLYCSFAKNRGVLNDGATDRS